MENNGGVSSSGVGDFKFGREHVAQVSKNDYDSEMSDSDAHAVNSVENSAFKEAKKAKKALKNAFTVNTSYCRTEVETLQHVIETQGFVEKSVGGKLYWFALALQDKDIKTIAKK